MAFVDPFRDDPQRSIRLDFGQSLRPEFSPLRDWAAGEVLRFHSLSLRRLSTVNQIVEAVDCILANLLHAASLDRGCFLAISMRSGTFTKSRYHQRNIGFENFRRAVLALRDIRDPYIILVPGFNDRRSNVGFTTRIRPTAKLFRILDGYIGGLERGELPRGAFNVNDLIAELLERNDQNAAPSPDISRFLVHQPASDVIRLRDGAREDVEYEDTDETTGMRDLLIQWNAFVAENFHVDLILPDDELLNVFSGRNRVANEREIFFGDQRDDTSFVDLTRTRLHRVFNNGTFDEGGRFYGAWWQSVPSAIRRFITINGVPTVEIDYSGLHANMLYAGENLGLPQDPYSIDGIDQQYRKLIKATFFKLINAQPGQRIRPPLAGRLPDGWSWQRLQDAIMERHAPIARHLRSGVGLHLQRIDSDIAERVMLRMQATDRLVLPVHDSFLTFIGLRDTLRGEMVDAYRQRMNAEIGTDLDPAFVEGLYDAAAEEQLNDADLVDWQQAQPGYDQYRRRQRAFLESRTEEWHRRFGDHQIQ